MKKVLIASFQYEACGLSKIFPTEADFEVAEGQRVFEKLPVKDIFEEAHIEPIPTFYTNALPGGMLTKALFEEFAKKILSRMQEYPMADGILLCCHGSCEVEQIGSGELELLRRIREIFGKTVPVAVSFDLHANIDVRIIDLIDIVCGYKTAPHTDQATTQRAAAKLLVKALKGQPMKTCIVKVPMLASGDAMLTAEEPLKSLIEETRQAEKDDVFRVNLFFSHMWVDAPNTCASVTVTASDEEKARSVAKVFARKFWETRREYRFLVATGSVEECVRKSLQESAGRVFLTDSGDNTTAGAEGNRLDILEAFLSEDIRQKKICISGITSKKIVSECLQKRAGDKVTIPMSGGTREGLILRFGKILGWAKDIVGDSVSVNVGGICVIFTEKRSAFISEENFRLAKEDIKDYDIVVVKQGYLFSELTPFCDKQYFVMSDGASCVDIRRLGLKRIPRPMFPLDDFEIDINKGDF